MDNRKEKLIDALGKSLHYGYGTLCLIAEELMSEGVTFATDNNVGDKWKPLPMTNADRIRAMSDEELGEWLCSIATAECCDRSCPARNMCDLDDNGLIKWLKQPAEGADNG